MRESTVEEYLNALKFIVDTTRQSIWQVATVASAKSESERQAVVAGMKLAPPMVIRTGGGESIPFNVAEEPNWKKLKKMLLKAPEPSKEEKEASLKLAKTAPYVIRKAFKQVAKKLPHAPGGHPFALVDPVERLAACKRIEAYRINEHMDTAEAVVRVAGELNRKHHIVSAKTLRRYYDEYIGAAKQSARK